MWKIKMTDNICEISRVRKHAVLAKHSKNYDGSLEKF